MRDDLENVHNKENGGANGHKIENRQGKFSIIWLHFAGSYKSMQFY
jgi:hypothetical protein